MKRATEHSCGYDITSAETYVLGPGERRAFSTGLFLELPDGVCGILKSRSSLALLGLDVCGGVIDSDYRGEIRVILHNTSRVEYIVSSGQRIAQMIVLKYETLGDSVDTKRNGGFGSTGL